MDAFVTRPKGMWQRTFDRHMERYWELDAECAVEMMTFANLLSERCAESSRKKR